MRAARRVIVLVRTTIASCVVRPRLVLVIFVWKSALRIDSRSTQETQLPENTHTKERMGKGSMKNLYCWQQAVRQLVLVTHPPFLPGLHSPLPPFQSSSAAAYGGHDAVAELGNQIFVTMRKGTSYPLAHCDVRVRYEQTIADLKAAVASAMGIPVAQQQLFWHKRELTAAYDNKTLLEMGMHTGFALRGYDLVSSELEGVVCCVQAGCGMVEMEEQQACIA